jgi:2-hydroxychromene-2-carboxylate isomerase
MTDSLSSSTALPKLEFWFEFGSNYSYLSLMRIEDEARRRHVRVVWKPFLLGPIFRALGFETSPFILQKEKGGLHAAGHGASLPKVRPVAMAYVCQTSFHG